MTAAQSLLGVLFAPLASAVLIACFLRRRGALAAVVSVGAAAAAGVFLLLALREGAAVEASVHWLGLGGFEARMGFLFDGTAATMAAMVVLVGFLIHLFSVGYMAEDEGRGRFFGGLSIFMFSMLGIVLADNLVMIFVFWELVGFSSYMLIGHYLKTSEAAEAAKKAFIVNRVGDLGFLIGIVLAYWHFGTVELRAMEAALALDPGLINAGIAALLMCGFIGKSAQFPLHVWLPDAMAGPTPVSALIHAATMVAAGVYFLIRTVFLFPPEVLAVITWLGAAMAVYAGLCAFAQNDIKRILAYSTLSQLGYMTAAFGLGFPGVALFHLVTHAFFKALLFLAAGSAIHGCHHQQDIFKMGGLLKRMPVTGLTFLAGVLALCGVYGLSGFYSKDAILIGGGLTHTPAFVLLLAGAFLTSGYMGRLYWVAFLGKATSEAASHARESGLVMTMPLIVLALLAVAGGWLQFWPPVLGAGIRADLDHLHHLAGYDAMHQKVLVLGSAAWVAGLLGALLFYGRGAREDRLEKSAPPLFGLLRSRLWFDEVYDFYVGKIQQRVADLAGFFDLFVIKGLLVRGSAGLAGLAGLFARGLHTGNIHNYVYWFLAGLAVFWALAGGWL
jgi:NADH-quinone oxidoreductase subunit L